MSFDKCELVVLSPGDGEIVEFMGSMVAHKVRAHQTGHRWAFSETREAPGAGPALHLHHDEPEAFYVLEGEYTFLTVDREETLLPGASVFVPPGVLHGFRAGPEGGRLLCVLPAGFDGFFFAVKEALDSGLAVPEVFRSIGESFNMSRAR